MHVDAVCEHLQEMIEDLLINIPPGFAKSMISAVFFPAWVWRSRPLDYLLAVLGLANSSLASTTASVNPRVGRAAARASMVRASLPR